MDAIVIGDLVKTYGSVEALKGVSLAVRQGEVVALLGPNGAGKTTLIEILEGYRARDSGRVSVLGFDPWTGGRPYRALIGLVLQSASVDPELTVREIISMYAGFYPRPRGVDEVIELVGLTDKRNERVKTLSGGQQRRIDLALGITGDPELVFLDEPTTGFDPAARRQAWDIIRGLRALGKTIILTTHYLDEAQQLADRVVVLAAGRVVAAGEPATLGGRELGTTNISFQLPAGYSLTELPSSVLAGALTEGRRVTVRTERAIQALGDLIDWARDRGIDLPDLSVTRPSLEDVYLELTAQEAIHA